jgi:hypothetical protein
LTGNYGYDLTFLTHFFTFPEKPENGNYETLICNIFHLQVTFFIFLDANNSRRGYNLGASFSVVVVDGSGRRAQAHWKVI